MSQQSRRRNPYLWTWEIPLGIALVILMALVCGVHLGRRIASLRGDAAAGLDGLNGSVSSPSAVWVWVVASEMVLLAVALLVLKLVVDQLGAGAAAWHG